MSLSTPSSNNNGSNNPMWKERLEKVLMKHFEKIETVHVVVAIYGTLRTVRRSMNDNVDDATRIGIMQMAYDLTTALPNNPFMQVYGQRVMAVASTALNSWIDSISYMTEAEASPDNEKRFALFTKGISTAHLVHEVATICLLCEQGPGVYRDKSRRLRDELTEIEDILA